jgi:hypothetical protein
MAVLCAKTAVLNAILQIQFTTCRCVGYRSFVKAIGIEMYTESWNGRFFEKVSLRRLGLIVQLGHPDGSTCDKPIPGPKKFLVIHVNGSHPVSLNYCGCSNSISTATSMQQPKWEQLMRSRWFPGTHRRPGTAFTFEMLNQFQMLNFCGKVNPYDYYKAMERLTNNTGAKIPVSTSLSPSNVAYVFVS